MYSRGTLNLMHLRRKFASSYQSCHDHIWSYELFAMHLGHLCLSSEKMKFLL